MQISRVKIEFHRMSWVLRTLGDDTKVTVVLGRMQFGENVVEATPWANHDAAKKKRRSDICTVRLKNLDPITLYRMMLC